MKSRFVLLALVLIASGCSIWPLGEDPKGKEIRIQADEIVNAIKNYENVNGNLPSDLLLLIPEFLKELPEVADEVNYLSDKREIVYSYSPSWPQSGRISCGLKIGNEKWSCGGYI